MHRLSVSFAALLLFFLVTLASAQEITVATYNVEHFASHFEGHRLAQRAATQPADDERKELIEMVKKANDEDNWETAEVITHKQFNPDILVIEECCNQEDLEFFNKRWLREAYQTVIVFPSNTERSQYLGLLAKPGFKIVDRRDQYYLEKDSVANERGERLFARGPAFVLIEGPTGYRFWLGVTHQKSKFGNDVGVTAWRNREAVRTHQIMMEITKEGPSDVILLGDMNDELGMQEFETEGGGDSIANLVGPEEDGCVLMTRELAKEGKQSFGGYWVPKYRSLIDHIIVSRDMAKRVEVPEIHYEGLARVSSDHFPVSIKIKPEAAATTQPAASQSASTQPVANRPD